jgi:hypothetical protein
MWVQVHLDEYTRPDTCLLACVRAPRRYQDAERDVRAALKFAAYIERENKEGANLRDALRQRQRLRQQALPPPPAYKDPQQSLDHRDGGCAPVVQGADEDWEIEDDVPEHGAQVELSLACNIQT